MAGRYKIGRCKFDTYQEYVWGVEDVKKIEKITHSVDIYEPDTALRLYEAIRERRIKFYSKIGQQFFLDIADIVAENTKKGIKKQKVVVNTDRGRKILGVVCLICAIVCFVWYFWADYTNHSGNQIKDYLKSLGNVSVEGPEMVSNNTFFAESSPEMVRSASAETEEVLDTPEQAAPEVLEEYRSILQENQDFAGWIRIDGTHVDYPVMLKKSQSDFYLNHDFYGGEDINGTLFMDARTDLTNRSTNIIIYGHNMKSGQMFGDLKKYLDEDFWKEHKTIVFDTIYEKGTYEIFAVCRAQVKYQDEEGFRYYDFIEAENEETYQNFLDNIIQLSVFADQELPSYGEELLTLSTCNNYVEDGRLFLVAKKCREAE